MIFEPFKKLLKDLRKHRLDIVAQQGSRNAAYHYESMANSLERAILQAEAIALAPALPVVVTDGEIPTALQRWESRDMATQKHWSIGEFRQAEIDAFRAAPVASPQ